MNQKIVLKKQVLAVFVLILSASAFISCEKYVYDPPKLDPNKQISFQSDIVPIFTSNCSCHVSGSQTPKLSPTKAYDALINGGYINTTTPSSSGIYTKIASGHNSDGVSDLDRQMILQWIKQGALNN